MDEKRAAQQHQRRRRNGRAYAREDVKSDGARAEIAGPNQFQPQLFYEFLTKAKSIVFHQGADVVA